MKAELVKILGELLNGQLVVVTDIKTNGQHEVEPANIHRVTSAGIQPHGAGMYTFLPECTFEIDANSRTITVYFPAARMRVIERRIITVINKNGPVGNGRYRPFCDNSEYQDWHAAELKLFEARKKPTGVEVT